MHVQTLLGGLNGLKNLHELLQEGKMVGDGFDKNTLLCVYEIFKQ